MPVGSGGGSGSGDIKAGGAFWEFTARESVSRTLDQIGQKLKSTDQLIKRIGGLSFAGSFLGGLAGGASLMSAIQKLGQSTADWVTNAKGFNKEMERSATLVSRLAELERSRQSRRDADIGRIGDPAKRRAEIVRELGLAGQEVGGAESVLAQKRDELARLGMGPGRKLPGVVGLDDAILNLVEKGQRFAERQLTSSEPFEKAVQEAEASHLEKVKRRTELQQRLADFDRDELKIAQEREHLLNFESSTRARGSNTLLSAIGDVLNKPQGEALREQMQYIQRGGGSMFQGIGGALSTIVGTGLGKMNAELLRRFSEVRIGMGGQNALQRFGVGENVLQLSLKAQMKMEENTRRENVARAVADGLEKLVLR